MTDFPLTAVTTRRVWNSFSEKSFATGGSGETRVQPPVWSPGRRLLYYLTSTVEPRGAARSRPLGAPVPCEAPVQPGVHVVGGREPQGAGGHAPRPGERHPPHEAP